MFSIRLLLSISLVFPLLSTAQEGLVATSKQLTRVFTEREMQFDLPLTALDTNSNRLELYHPLYRLVASNNLGNIGLPAQSVIFNSERTIGFNYAPNVLDAYFINPSKTQYISTRSPYTDVFYTQGGPELLLLKIKHAQNINPRWNAGIDFNRITCNGDLLRQHASFYGLNAFTSYYTKQKHYVILANLTWNNGNNNESGGITSDSSYESLTGSLKQVYTNLSNCSTIYHSRGVYVKQFYRFGADRRIIIDKDTTFDFIPKKQLVLTTQAQEFSSAFYNAGDTNSVLLPNQFYDVYANTYDSVYTRKVSNQLAYQHFMKDRKFEDFGFKNDSVRSQYSIGFRHEWSMVAQPVFIRNYQNYIVDATLDNILLSDFKPIYHLGLSYVLAGYNTGDYKVDALQRIKTKGFTFNFQVALQKYHPDFFNSYYKSNQFIWNKDFKSIETSSIQVGFRTNKWRNNLNVQFKLQTLNNYVYLNINAIPEQAKDVKPVNIISVELNKTFQLWKFRFEHLVYVQYADQDYIRIPAVSGIVRYYFQSKFFGFAKFQLGVNMTYNSAYKGNAYNPSLRQFYLQDDVTIGNYPVISPFFVGDLNRASLFFMYEHLNQDWSNKGFYASAHYPIPLQAFRMGVRWRLYE